MHGTGTEEEEFISEPVHVEIRMGGLLHSRKNHAQSGSDVVGMEIGGRFDMSLVEGGSGQGL